MDNKISSDPIFSDAVEKALRESGKSDSEIQDLLGYRTEEKVLNEEEKKALEVILSEDEKADANFIYDFLNLTTPIEAIKLSIKIAITLLLEVKHGSIVTVTDTSGAKYKLVLGDWEDLKWMK
jgi:hypothetical protein